MSRISKSYLTPFMEELKNVCPIIADTKYDDIVRYHEKKLKAVKETIDRYNKIEEPDRVILTEIYENQKYVQYHEEQIRFFKW